MIGVIGRLVVPCAWLGELAWDDRELLDDFEAILDLTW